jgi:integrase
MGKKKRDEVQCANFAWKLFVRDSVYYADGRSSGLGKHSLNTRNRQQAIRKLFDLDRIVFEKRNPDQTGPTATDTKEKMDVQVGMAEGWDEYLAYGDRPTYLDGWAKSTKSIYRRMKSRSVEYFAKTTVRFWNELDEKAIIEYGNFLNRKLEPRTVHHELIMMISVSNWLIFHKRIPESCKIRLKLSKPTGSDTYCYSRDQVARMIKYCFDDSNLIWLGRLIAVLSHTGLRLGEAIELRWSDVDFQTGFISVIDERFRKQSRQGRRHVKDGDSRSVPMHESLRSVLASIATRTGNVLTSPRGGKLTANFARNWFIKDVINKLKSEYPSSKSEIGFKDGRFHSLRHFFCSEAFSAGVNEGDIRSWLGHSDSKIVELYRHQRREDSKRSMNQINFGASDDQQKPDDAGGSSSVY